MAQMSAAQRDGFLREARIASLVTLYAGGAPTVAPVWFEWDGERARLFTSAGSEKVRRLRADPRVCLAVAEPTGVPEAWVTIEGTAAIHTAGGWELAQRLAPRYYAPAQAARALADWQQSAADWALIEITPRRIRSLAPG